MYDADARSAKAATPRRTMCCVDVYDVALCVAAARYRLLEPRLDITTASCDSTTTAQRQLRQLRQSTAMTALRQLRQHPPPNAAVPCASDVIGSKGCHRVS